MTDKEVEMTLVMLKGAIHSVEEKGQSIDSIKVGHRLYDAIIAYNISLLSLCRLNSGSLRMIYGISVDIDYRNPWVLRVLTAVDVPVMRESEVSGNEYDGE